jgi:hypothetical protein
MPCAKEMSPFAILGTRSTGSAAHVSKKVEDFTDASHCDNVTQLTTSPLSLLSDIPHRFSRQSKHQRGQNIIYACKWGATYLSPIFTSRYTQLRLYAYAA